MKIVPNKTILALVAMFLCFLAQASPSNPPPPPTPPPPPPGLPLDQGLVFLVLAAIIYGIYKIIQNQNSKKSPA